MFRTAPTLATVIAVYCIARRHITAHRRRNLTVVQRLLCANHLEPRAGRSGVRISAGTRDVPLFQIFQTGCEAHPASYSMGTGVLSRG
jgi:hypothetical protein